MSNNRNRNRSNQNRGNVPAQDRPFIYNGKRGRIVIPSSVEFDPDAESALELADAQASGDEIQAMAAMLSFIKSGFPDEISETINLKISELADFTQKFMKFSGVNIPK